MININDVVNRVSGSKDLIAEQNFKHLTIKLNTFGLVFDAVEGLGADAVASSMVFINSGGYTDQKITAVLNYSAATAMGSEDIGVVLRMLTIDSTDDTYYYARVVGGFATIVRVVDNIWSTLTSQAFPLAQGDNVTITFSAVGNVLSAEFDAGGSPPTVNLSVIDNNISSGGLAGFRSLNSAVWCRSLAWEQL